MKQYPIRGRYVNFDIEIEHILHIVCEVLLVINNNKNGDSMELGLYLASLTWNLFEVLYKNKV
jgi:hypothetical protein